MKLCKTLYINGTSVVPANGTLDVLNPATEKVLASAPVASSDQMDQAVAAARSAFVQWRDSSDEERSEALLRIADRMETHADELARIIVHEQGKPLMIAQREVAGATAWVRYTAGLTLPVDVVFEDDSKRIEVHRKPLGVVGSITPWNWPLMILIWHLMPALKAGNTVVCKPSEYTPFHALRLFEIIGEELPAGVINVVNGRGDIGQAMSEHDGIDKIVFTGSIATGKRIMGAAAGNLKRLTLELGGNDAAVVLPDVDLEQAAEGIIAAAYKNMGQTCAALKRLYVHEDIHDALCEKLVAVAQRHVVGDGMEPGVTFGPVQNSMQYTYLCGLLDDIREQGGIFLCGGEPLPGKGYLIPPTIVTNVDPHSRIVQEEQFGPILPVIPFNHLEDVITLVNEPQEGLGGSVWSADIEKAQAISSRFECGSTWINFHGEVHPSAPFGGCKQSGLGVEFGQEGLMEYTSVQTRHILKQG